MAHAGKRKGMTKYYSRIIKVAMVVQVESLQRTRTFPEWLLRDFINGEVMKMET